MFVAVKDSMSGHSSFWAVLLVVWSCFVGVCEVHSECMQNRFSLFNCAIVMDFSRLRADGISPYMRNYSTFLGKLYTNDEI